jgi:hypothetical protein
MSSDELITVTRKKGGRPKGAVTQNDPASISRVFGPLSREGIRRLIEKGDATTIQKMFRFCYGDQAPLPTISLGNIESPEDGKRAMAQLFDFIAQGKISLDQGERLQNMIAKYFEICKMDDLVKSV